MKERKLEKALEDIGSLECGSWQLVTFGNRQYSSSGLMAVKMKNRYEVLALQEKEPTPVSGEAISCTTEGGGIKTTANKRKSQAVMVGNSPVVVVVGLHLMA